MASTRRPQPPIDIYQDTIATPYIAQNVESSLIQSTPQYSDPTRVPFQQINNQSRKQIPPFLDPSAYNYRMASPCKPLPSSPAIDPNVTNQQNASPLYTNTHIGRPFTQSAISSQPVLSSNDSVIMDKENIFAHPMSMTQQNFSPQSDVFGSKAPLKRGSADDNTPLKDKTNAKKPRIEDLSFEIQLPEPHEMPEVEDDGTKPPHSYATLIGMAILRAPNRRLTLAQIYKWISDHYKFYRAAEAGWQNSIRHNLSLNKNFIKQERPKDDPGKGNYWAIRAGQEFMFIKDRPVRRLPCGDESGFMQGALLDFAKVERPSSAPAVGHFALEPPGKKHRDVATFESSHHHIGDHPSSDATLPASDPALQDDAQPRSHGMPPPAPRHRRSISPTPPHDINSSPPPMVSDVLPQATPSGLPKMSTESLLMDRGDSKHARVHDSGFFSSIESSVTHGSGFANAVSASETDTNGSRVRRGRAEEEIARLRSSSFDSPTKDPADRKKATAAQSGPGSPSRTANDASGRVPLTPGIVFKRPAIPIPAASPNTNLKDHRARMHKLLGESPNRTQTTPKMDNFQSWSPHFSMTDQEDVIFGSPSKPNVLTPWRDSLFSNAYDALASTFNDNTAANGSPQKRTERPLMDRAVTSTGILADITGNTLERSNAAMTSFGQSPFNAVFPTYKMDPTLSQQRQNSIVASPVKRPSTSHASGLQVNHNEFASEWLDLSMENFFGIDYSPMRVADLGMPSAATEFASNVQLPSDGSEEGVDILQEFGKIGAIVTYPQARPNGQAAAYGSSAQGQSLGVARPPMSRSVTSRF